MTFERFVARRIYSDKAGEQRFSRPAVRIAMAGIAIGLVVMLLSIAIVLGFKSEVSGKVIGFGSHAQVISLTQDQDHNILPVVANDSLLRAVRTTPGVTRVQRYVEKTGMLKTDDDFLGVQVRGVGNDYDLTFIRSYLVSGTLPHLSADHTSDSIVISQRIARALHLRVGDRVFAYFLGHATDTTPMRARRFTVAGIYATHLAEYDKVMCYTDLRTVRRLNKWKDDEVSGLELRVRDFDNVDAVTREVSRRVSRNTDRIGATRGAFTIKELSPHVFAWLEVLDVNVIIILVLMMLIGGFTVVSGLLIVMLERIHTIALLKALGATNMDVRRIFIHFATMLVSRGILIGDAVGLLLCFVQQRWAVIGLDAETYYIDSVPIAFDWPLIAIINIGVLIISTLIILGSSFLISLKGPAATLRFE